MLKAAQTMRLSFALGIAASAALLVGGSLPSYAQSKSLPLGKYQDLLTSYAWFTDQDANGSPAAKTFFYFVFSKDGTFSYKEHEGQSEVAGGVGTWKLDGTQLKLEFEQVPKIADAKTRTSTIEFLPHEENMYVVLQENGKNFWHPECGENGLPIELSSNEQDQTDTSLNDYPRLLASEGWYTGFLDPSGDKQSKNYSYFLFKKGHPIKDLDGTFTFTHYENFEESYGGVGAWKLDGDKLTLDFEHDPKQTMTIKFISIGDGGVIVQQDGKTYWHPER